MDKVRSKQNHYVIDDSYFSDHNIGRGKAIAEGWGELYDVIENQKSNNLEYADHVVFSEEARSASYPANLTSDDSSTNKISGQENLSGDQMVYGRVDTDSSLVENESTREGGFSMPQSPDRYDLKDEDEQKSFGYSSRYLRDELYDLWEYRQRPSDYTYEQYYDEHLNEWQNKSRVRDNMLRFGNRDSATRWYNDRSAFLRPCIPRYVCASAPFLLRQ